MQHYIFDYYRIKISHINWVYVRVEGDIFPCGVENWLKDTGTILYLKQDDVTNSLTDGWTWR